MLLYSNSRLSGRLITADYKSVETKSESETDVDIPAASISVSRIWKWKFIKRIDTVSIRMPSISLLTYNMAVNVFIFVLGT